MSRLERRKLRRQRSVWKPTTSFASRPSWIARRIALGQHAPVVRLRPGDVDELRERRVRAAPRARSAARGRGGSRGRRPRRRAARSSSASDRVGERAVDRRRSRRPRRGGSRGRCSARTRAPRGSAGGTRASGWRRRCSTSRRRAASWATSRSRYGEPSRATSSIASPPARRRPPGPRRSSRSRSR